MTPAPTQYMPALERANKVRLARSEVKHQLRDRSMPLEQALEHPAVRTMAIGQLLESQQRWGRDRVRRVLAWLRLCAPPVMVSELRNVGDLTDRERAAIVQACKETGR
jgi:hypothetical protein